jgi:hypothetical protein
LGAPGESVATTGVGSLTGVITSCDTFFDDLAFVFLGSSLSFFFFDIISVPWAVDYPRDWQALQNKSSKILRPK